MCRFFYQWALQQSQIEVLTKELQKVSAQLEASKPTLQVVNNPESRLEFGLGLSRGFRRANDLGLSDAHRDNGKRFVVRSDQMLTAFLELERITHELALSALLGDDGNSLSR